MNMKEFFDEEFLVDGINEQFIQDDIVPLDTLSSAVKNMTHRRQIEIMRENKLLMSSLKDIYDS